MKRSRPLVAGVAATLPAQSPPDGCTIQMAARSTHAIGPSLDPTIPCKAPTDFTPAAHVANATSVRTPDRGTALVIPDMVSGQIRMPFDNVASAHPRIKDGRVKALAVASLTRSALPSRLPKVADTVPGFKPSTWFGVFGPKNLPRE
ncbi:MAG TPA: tripartite tricarboxylate transporter substrate-binding protein [Burkholderiaceae bacterium]|nr:tripartite tricarboxylate transporter substrate-binding protein [Burkholderiaceae bacterium]